MFINFFRTNVFVLLLILLCGNANAIESCKGKRVFSCASLAKTIATKKKCYQHYECRELQNGETCFQCKLSINKLTRGLCDEDRKTQCLKKDI